MPDRDLVKHLVGRRVKHSPGQDTMQPKLVAELGRSWIKAGPLRGPAAPPGPGYALGRPPGPGRANADSGHRLSRLIQTRPGQAIFLGSPLSSSRAPRPGRPPGVATRWLRQPRPGTCSQGFGACEEDGEAVSRRLPPRKSADLSLISLRGCWCSRWC